MGKRNALAYGCPHPNEPMGAIAMEYFSRALAGNRALRERLGYTWYIIQCSDPDGTRLNEKWFGQPDTVYRFARNVYRPAAYKQVEWTFPIHYKTLDFDAPIPETRALMKLIEDLKPHFIYSLHNAMFGGAYWYLLNPLEEPMYEALRESARRRGIALRLGEPESPSCKMLSPAVYLHGGAKEQYDYFEAIDEAPDHFPHGTNVVDIARENGTKYILLSELPLFYSSDAENEALTDIDWGHSLQEARALNNACMSFVQHTLERFGEGLPEDSVFLISLRERIDTWAGSLALSKSLQCPMDERPAKVSEVLNNRYETLLFNMITVGMLVRAFEQELSGCGYALPIRSIVQVIVEDLFVVTDAMKEEEYDNRNFQ